jgi:hypothetical protein
MSKEGDQNDPHSDDSDSDGQSKDVHHIVVNQDDDEEFERMRSARDVSAATASGSDVSPIRSEQPFVTTVSFPGGPESFTSTAPETTVHTISTPNTSRTVITIRPNVASAPPTARGTSNPSKRPLNEGEGTDNQSGFSSTAFRARRRDEDSDSSISGPTSAGAGGSPISTSSGMSSPEGAASTAAIAADEHTDNRHSTPKKVRRSVPREDMETESEEQDSEEDSIHHQILSAASSLSQAYSDATTAPIDDIEREELEAAAAVAGPSTSGESREIEHEELRRAAVAPDVSILQPGALEQLAHFNEEDTELTRTPQVTARSSNESIQASCCLVSALENLCQCIGHCCCRKNDAESAPSDTNEDGQSTNSWAFSSSANATRPSTSDTAEAPSDEPDPGSGEPNQENEEDRQPQ